MTNDPLFLDAAYAIALAIRADQRHSRAAVISREILAERRPMITTTAVMLEIGDALSRRRFRADAVRLLQGLSRDPLVEVVPLSDPLYSRALHLFVERADKEWGLTDCISFVVMWERGISGALTADRHFSQAGFQALLGA